MNIIRFIEEKINGRLSTKMSTEMSKKRISFTF